MQTDQHKFLKDVNKNIAIVHKVCHIYFAGDPEERRDVYQEIMYQLWKSYPRFNGASKFSTWMYKVALNTAITYVKKDRGRKIRLTGEDCQITGHDTQTMEDNIQRLYREINRLSSMDKAIILLYLEKNTYEEIAAVTGLTKTNVSVRLVRIKKALKKKFNHKSNYNEVM